MRIRGWAWQRPGVPTLAVCGLVALTTLGGAAPASAQGASTTAPAAAPETSATEEVESLRARVAIFWAARVKGDATAQWELLEPRGHNQMSAAEYVPGGHAVKYLGYQVEGAKVNGYFATVKLRLVVVPIMPPGRSVGAQVVVAEDSWVRIRGTWYRSLEQDQAQRAFAAGG